MMWREEIASLIPECEFRPPAAWAEFTIAQEKLGTEIPPELKELLGATNGVFGQYGISLIWTLERIVEENLSIRSVEDSDPIYMPRDCFLFFADAGNGDLFGYSIVRGQIKRPDVFAWSHEDDSRMCVATSLPAFIKGWLTGEIKL